MPLSDDDLVWLVRQIAATSELLGQEMKPNAAALLAEDLSSYDRQTLAVALHRVRTEHTGKLTPKAIIDRIDEIAGRPAANEAWAMAMSAQDERNTVVWTQEAAEAWSIAKPIADTGDMVGARMAFIAAYERLVRAAREERRLPVVTVSLGWDEQLRSAAIEKAVKAGYLSSDAALEYTPERSAIGWVNPVKLLTGEAEPGHAATPEQREMLRKLRDDIASSGARRAEAAALRAKEEAEETARRKREIQRAVDERIQKGEADVRSEHE